MQAEGAVQEVLKHHYLLPRENFHQSEEKLYGIDFKFNYFWYTNNVGEKTVLSHNLHS